MDDLYSEKIFEFTNWFLENEELYEDIKLVQIGETCLDKGATLGGHVQFCHELTLIVSGEGFLSADSEKVPCSHGDVQLISKGVSHNIIAAENSRLRYIHFAFDFNEASQPELSEFFGQCKHIILHDDGSLRNLLGMLVDEYYNNYDFTSRMRSSLMQLILIQLWRKTHNKTDKYVPVISSEPLGSTVYSIIKFIDENTSDKLTVERLAQKFSYSKSYISHLFKSKTGVALREYIIASRMRYARALIAEGKSTLAEIAELTGYETTQAFCKAFKKYTGETPGKSK